MNKPQLVEKTSFTLAGISVRTINRDEANPKTAKLAAFWTKFRNENIPALIPNALANSPVYGAYFDYESDETGHTLRAMESRRRGRVVPGSLRAGCFSEGKI